MKQITIVGLSCLNCHSPNVKVYKHMGYNNVEHYVCICHGLCKIRDGLELPKRIFFGQGNTENLKNNLPYFEVTE